MVANRVGAAYLSMLTPKEAPLASLGSTASPLTVTTLPVTLRFVNTLSFARSELVELISTTPLSVAHGGESLSVSSVPQNGSVLTYFTADVPPLASVTYTITADSARSVAASLLTQARDEPFTLCPPDDSLCAAFSTLGELKSLTHNSSTTSLAASFRSYASGVWLGSGAYLFRIRFWPAFLIVRWISVTRLTTRSAGSRRRCGGRLVCRLHHSPRVAAPVAPPHSLPHTTRHHSSRRLCWPVDRRPHILRTQPTKRARREWRSDARHTGRALPRRHVVCNRRCDARTCVTYL